MILQITNHKCNKNYILNDEISVKSNPELSIVLCVKFLFPISFQGQTKKVIFSLVFLGLIRSDDGSVESESMWWLEGSLFGGVHHQGASGQELLHQISLEFIRIHQRGLQKSFVTSQMRKKWTWPTTQKGLIPSQEENNIWNISY